MDCCLWGKNLIAVRQTNPAPTGSALAPAPDKQNKQSKQPSTSHAGQNKNSKVWRTHMHRHTCTRACTYMHTDLYGAGCCFSDMKATATTQAEEQDNNNQPHFLNRKWRKLGRLDGAIGKFLHLGCFLCVLCFASTLSVWSCFMSPPSNQAIGHGPS